MIQRLTLFIQKHDDFVFFATIIATVLIVGVPFAVWLMVDDVNESAYLDTQYTQFIDKVYGDKYKVELVDRVVKRDLENFGSPDMTHNIYTIRLENNTLLEIHCTMLEDDKDSAGCQLSRIK